MQITGGIRFDEKNVLKWNKKRHMGRVRGIGRIVENFLHLSPAITEKQFSSTLVSLSPLDCVEFSLLRVNIYAFTNITQKEEHRIFNFKLVSNSILCLSVSVCDF